MARTPLDLSKLRLETRLPHAGRDRTRSEGGVNPPIQRATTPLIDDTDDLYKELNATGNLRRLGLFIDCMRRTGPSSA